MNLWKIKDLPEPPINTYKATNTKIDIKHLYDVFQEGVQYFDDNKYIYAEHAILSRIVYRMKQKFHTAKDFKALEMIKKTLDNYFKIDITRNLKNFIQLIPSGYKKETYLPTKNLLDYILIRLQSIVKLMERIVETCKIAAYLLDNRIRIGHFWKIAFITFSLVSRIYVLAKYTTKCTCEFYNKLFPFSRQLSSTSKSLPHYNFPTDLKEWMSVDWLEFDDEIQIIEIPPEIPDIIKFFDLVDDDDDEVQFCDEYVMVEDNEIKPNTNLKKMDSINLETGWDMRGFDIKEDVGEIIEVNDNIQIQDENSSSVINHKNNMHSTINILSDTDEILEESSMANNSIQFENSSISTDSDVIITLPMEDNPVVMTEEVKTVETEPDISLTNKKQKRKKRRKEKKLKAKENEHSLIEYIDLEEEVAESDDIIMIPDTPLIQAVNEKQMEKDQIKANQNGTTFNNKVVASVDDCITMSDMETNYEETPKKKKKIKKKIQNGDKIKNKFIDKKLKSKIKLDILSSHTDSMLISHNNNYKQNKNVKNTKIRTVGNDARNFGNRKRKMESDDENFREVKKSKQDKKIIEKKLKKKLRKEKRKLNKNKPLVEVYPKTNNLRKSNDLGKKQRSKLKNKKKY